MFTSSTCRVFVTALLLLGVTSTAPAEHWPGFRGPNANGVADAGFPKTWGVTRNVRWKRAVAGEGWSQPVVWGDKLFLTVAVNTNADGADTRPEPYRGGGGRERRDLAKSNYRWEVLCLDAETGDVRWRETAHTGKPPMPRHSSNSYATETPVTDGKRVYAYFGMVGLFCYSLDGKPVWKKDLGSYEMRAGWGTSSSPALHDGKLFIQVDNEERSFLVAIDAESGDEIWRVKRDERSQYSSPIVWRNSKRAEVVVGGQHYRSYAPATGDLLWSLDMDKGRSSATPIAVGDRLLVGTEFRNRGGSDDGGGFLYCVRPGGTGDITPEDESGKYVEWRIPRSGIQMASPVVCRGFVYLLERRSNIVRCYDVKNGELAYEARIPGARAFWASPWTDGELVYCLDGSGTTFALAAGPELQVVGENALEEQAWSSPAVSDGELFVRTIGHLYCVGSTASN